MNWPILCEQLLPFAAQLLLQIYRSSVFLHDWWYFEWTASFWAATWHSTTVFRQSIDKWNKSTVNRRPNDNNVLFLFATIVAIDYYQRCVLHMRKTRFRFFCTVLHFVLRIDFMLIELFLFLFASLFSLCFGFEYLNFIFALRFPLLMKEYGRILFAKHFTMKT